MDAVIVIQEFAKLLIFYISIKAAIYYLYPPDDRILDEPEEFLGFTENEVSQSAVDADMRRLVMALHKHLPKTMMEMEA